MITRRKLLVLLGSYMLAACSPLAPSTPQPTQIPAEIKLPPTQQPTATPTVTPSQTPTMTPTALPTRTPTATPKPVLQAPKIEGLVSREVEGQTLYFAEAGNSYGLEGNQYAGRIKTNVSIEGEETGAMFLVPAAAEKFLLEELAKITEGPKLRFAIPVDPLNEEPIKLSFYKGYAGTTIGMLKIDFSGEAILSSLFPGLQSITVGLDVINDQYYVNQWLLMDKHFAILDKSNAINYLYVIGGSLGLEPQTTLQNVSFGGMLSENSTGPIYIADMSTNDWINITADHILKIQNLPVFIEKTSS